MRISRYHRLHVLAAALCENSIDVDVTLLIVAFFLSDIDRNRHSEEHPVRYDEDNFSWASGGLRGGKAKYPSTNSVLKTKVTFFMSAPLVGFSICLKPLSDSSLSVPKPVLQAGRTCRMQ